MAFRDAIPKMNFAARKNLARLCRQFGREQALQEYRWMMMESKILNPLAPSPGASLTLARMLRRRARGEPLQYILGDFRSTSQAVLLTMDSDEGS